MSRITARRVGRLSLGLVPLIALGMLGLAKYPRPAAATAPCGNTECVSPYSCEYRAGLQCYLTQNPATCEMGSCIKPEGDE